MRSRSCSSPGPLASEILSQEPEAELAAYNASLNPLRLASEIDRLQQRLITLAAGKTRSRQNQVNAKAALPDITGIKLILLASKPTPADPIVGGDCYFRHEVTSRGS